MNKKVKHELKKIEVNPLKRLTHSTPKYFKVLIGFGITLIGLSLSIDQLPQELKDSLPQVIVRYANYVSVVGGTIIFMASQTIDKDKIVAKLQEKYKNKED